MYENLELSPSNSKPEQLEGATVNEVCVFGEDPLAAATKRTSMHISWSILIFAVAAGQRYGTDRFTGDQAIFKLSVKAFTV